jgi:hypothetical protein
MLPHDVELKRSNRVLPVSLMTSVVASVFADGLPSAFDTLVRLNMPLSIASAILSSQLVVTVADRVPNLDVKPGCRESSISDCLSLEEAARAELAKGWPNFSPREKAQCAEEAKQAGAPSYIQWLTCLQINANARNVPLTTTGQGSRH